MNKEIQILIDEYSSISHWIDFHLAYKEHKTNTYEKCIVDAHIQSNEAVLSKTIDFV